MQVELNRALPYNDIKSSRQFHHDHLLPSRFLIIISFSSLPINCLYDYCRTAYRNADKSLQCIFLHPHHDLCSLMF